jgi:hypothetical protein
MTERGRDVREAEIQGLTASQVTPETADGGDVRRGEQTPRGGDAAPHEEDQVDWKGQLLDVLMRTRLTHSSAWHNDRCARPTSPWSG